MTILNVVSFKIVCYNSLAIMFEYVSFSFPPFGTIHEVSGWNGFLDTAESNKTIKNLIKCKLTEFGSQDY